MQKIALAPRDRFLQHAFQTWKGVLEVCHDIPTLALHLVWTTLNREAMLTRPAAAKASQFLTDYACEKNIYMKINYFNPEHTHALIDLPTNRPIEDVIQLFKGSSSHWINENQLLKGRFAWGRGYGAFSVSHSHADQVAGYIASQEKHHQRKNFNQEFELLVKRYGLEWFED
jgi:REP element-mobilizing transposase RayT